MKATCVRIAAFALAMLLGAVPAYSWPAHPKDYLFVGQMPTVEQVRRDVRGDSPLDTDGRLHAAFVLLGNLVDVSADGKKVLPWPPRERELKGRYSAALGPILGNDNGFDRHDLDVFRLSSRYRADPAFTRPLLRKYFSAAAMSELEPILVMMDAASATSYENQYGSADAPATDYLRVALALFASFVPIGRHLLDVPTAFWLLLVLAWILWRIARVLPFRLDDKNPLRLRVGRKYYSIQYMTGHVIKVDRSTRITTSTSYTSVQDAGGVWQSIPSTHVHTHQQFRVFLTRPDGSETEITLSGVDLPLREGHRLAAVWGLRGKEKTGYYLFFHIYDMRRTQPMPYGIKQLVRTRSLMAVPILIAATAAPYLLAPALVNAFPWILFAVPAACFIVLAVFLTVVERRRDRRFRTKMIDQILTAIPEPASVVTAPALPDVQLAAS